MTRPAAAPAALYLTDDAESCELLARDGNALLIGFILDQQVTVQKAFAGPTALIERVGTIDPASLAAMPIDQLEAAFADKPAIHRYPSAMAGRVRDAMQIVVDSYAGDATNIWATAADTDELAARLTKIPGIGKGKVLTMTAVLARQLGYPFTGWESQVPEWGTLGDVDSPEALTGYQSRKRAHKAALRAAASS